MQDPGDVKLLVTVAGEVLDAAVKATWIYSVVYQVMFHVGGLSGRRRSL